MVTQAVHRITGVCAKKGVASLNERYYMELSQITAMSASTGIHIFMLWIYRFIRICLGVVFVISGWSKLMDPQSFVFIIQAYGLVADSLLLPVAIGLSLLELLSGIALIIDIQYALTTIAGLIVLFMLILGYGLWLGLDVDCGCFAADDPEGQAYHGLRPSLYRDAAMLAGIIYLYFWRWQRSYKPILFSDLYKKFEQTRR